MLEDNERYSNNISSLGSLSGQTKEVEYQVQCPHSLGKYKKQT